MTEKKCHIFRYGSKAGKVIRPGHTELNETCLRHQITVQSGDFFDIKMAFVRGVTDNDKLLYFFINSATMSVYFILHKHYCRMIKRIDCVYLSEYNNIIIVELLFTVGWK